LAECNHLHLWNWTAIAGARIGTGLAWESSWSLPEPVTGPNGAPAWMLISEAIVRKTIIINEGEPIVTVQSISNKVVLYLCKEPSAMWAIGITEIG
jgi:hypothetical protein